MNSREGRCLPRAVRLGAGLVAVGTVLVAQNLAGGWVDTLLLYLPGADKVLHGLEFIGIFIAVHWLAGFWLIGPRRRLLAAASVTALLAAGDELQQGLTASRSVELNDLVADVCGLAVGVVAVQRNWRTAIRVGVAFGAVVAVAALTFDSYLARRDFNLGQRYERLGEFGLARTAYLRALESGLESAALFNSLGWVEVESGEGTADQAVEYAAKALALRPRDADVLDTYGWALQYAGRSSEALAPLLEAESMNPRMFCIHYHLGVVYQALGRHDEAAAHYRQQVALAPGARETARARKALDRLRLPTSSSAYSRTGVRGPVEALIASDFGVGA